MPFIQSIAPVYKRALLNNLLAALSARPAAALLVTPFVHLFSAHNGPVTQDSLIADFTEATFVGYSAQALALPLVGPINADAAHSGVHNEVDFLGGAVVAPGQNILGYWIDEAASGGAVLYMAEVFQSPIAIAHVGDYISLDVVFGLPWAELFTPGS